MSKQTAVEWLAEQTNAAKWKFADMTDRNAIIEQAKQMEKEQIVDGWLNGMKGEMIAPLSINNYKSEAEDYYNETYGGTE